MGAAVSLLPELEAVVQHGSAQQRAETLRRITTLFLDRAAHFNDEHVALFDDVIGLLIKNLGAEPLTELARKLAPIGNAPANVVRALANDDDIEVAGPVLRQAKLDGADLEQIAATKGQAHLLALSLRQAIGEELADILVARGDREVACSVAANDNARLSEAAFITLVKQAEQDGELGEKLSLRTDIPPHLFQQLLMRGSDLVQKRLLAQARPERTAEIEDLPPETTGEAEPGSHAAALAAVRALHQHHKLGEADIAEFAESGQYEETIAALATVCAVPIEVVDRLMKGERIDPVLILGRAAGFDWPTVRAIIGVRPNAKLAQAALDSARENFERLTAATAQRVVRFWQVRPDSGE
jgi:uncharacterized protein (DUF2336 family)